MIFNSHSELAGLHAFLGPSKYHWVNYDPEKLDETYRNSQAARRGVELHALAHELIRLKVKLPRTQQTLNMYVNDAIGYRMTCEQALFYSENCYGHADTISFNNDFLRIHDLKTGVIVPGNMMQLVIYAALCCLEYGIRPGNIKIELRIYQNDEVIIDNPEVDVIAHVMSKIVTFDQRIEQIKAGGLHDHRRRFSAPLRYPSPFRQISVGIRERPAAVGS
jgi:Protein of unknown function (DUF2800)